MANLRKTLSNEQKTHLKQARAYFKYIVEKLNTIHIRKNVIEVFEYLNRSQAIDVSNLCRNTFNIDFTGRMRVSKDKYIIRAKIVFEDGKWRLYKTCNMYYWATVDKNIESVENLIKSKSKHIDVIRLEDVDNKGFRVSVSDCDITSK